MVLLFVVVGCACGVVVVAAAADGVEFCKPSKLGIFRLAIAVVLPSTHPSFEPFAHKLAMVDRHWHYDYE